MTLILQIENFQVLDDGGPATVTVPLSGLQAGRSVGMGWVLPDASRHISGHHFDVYHDGRDWWLGDCSTNGTFLQGQRHRLDGAHRLQDGDRFQVGQYIIIALINHAVLKEMSVSSLPEYDLGQPAIETSPVAADDPWAIGGSGGAPITPVDPMPPVPSADRQADFASDFLPLSATVPVVLSDAQEQAAPQSADPAAFLAAFARGAGVAPELMAGVDAEELGHALGETLRIVSEQLAAALQDRANARHFTRAAERTMRGASDNNPLKFLPDPEQAIEALFLRPRAGFLVGAAGYYEAISDLRRHQAAVFAALQPALLRLVDDLEPTRIEAEVKGGALTGSRKARAWDIFIARWHEKAAHDNGILDEFIRLFAEAYRKADGGRIGE
ncbi:MAG: type VI secretion system-associated FHA domain protein TagH [Paracoccus sp. (in: a-proteobacteria)]|uniref:type VI secretion system-associated FHA domain protein TagH n=1 Tax=Paracoccus sp. TaxID=267 RepID=UPI0026E060D7|nr:type VI secretion system-associated FHA domain protein TagH [Paracoccus sp. (in: a-proteobacteria)]MDO5622765.1 type VI secretion system-associated FHA domain protein TagH [Paracoccus sp. (in: a-proteobacteria)]